MKVQREDQRGSGETTRNQPRRSRKRRSTAGPDEKRSAKKDMPRRTQPAAGGVESGSVEARHVRGYAELAEVLEDASTGLLCGTLTEETAKAAIEGLTEWMEERTKPRSDAD